jgi:hypothetical protein
MLKHSWRTVERVGLLSLVAGTAFAQAPATLPNPYRGVVENWAKLPSDRPWGAAPAISIDRQEHIWVFERCGANSCAGRSENPVLEFDAAGKLLTSFGSGMFVFPHGIFVDQQDNVWVADADGKDGKGHIVVKFSPGGKVLMTLGKPGVAGDTPDTFNRPTGVVVAPNGDIYVSDGHGGDSNARIVKFSKDGKYLTSWGRKGKGPGEFDTLHGIALDSKGRVFVVDRGNNRIQIFDPNGRFLDQWTQFSNPSGIYIQQSERHIYRPQRRDLRGRRHQQPEDSARVAEGHPHWQRERWFGHRADSRPRGRRRRGRR